MAERYAVKYMDGMWCILDWEYCLPEDPEINCEQLCFKGKENAEQVCHILNSEHGRKISGTSNR